MKFNNEIANTLYIPLTMKALETAKPDGLFQDYQAQQLLEQMHIALPKMDLPVMGMQIGTAVRVKLFDERVADFIRRHNNALVVHIGCGLDNRLLRINAINTAAINIDLPEVIAVRNKYITEVSSLVENKDFSIFENQWLDYIQQYYANRPIIFIAEGVLMYFSDEQASLVINAIRNNFKNAEFWFDSGNYAVNELMNKMEYFKKFSELMSEDEYFERCGLLFKWSLDDASSLTAENFQLIESLAIMGCFPEVWKGVAEHAPQPYIQGSRINGYRVG